MEENAQIIEETFNLVLRNFRGSQEIDLSEVSFIDPYGMVGLLEIGELLKIDGIRKTILLPQSEDVLKYLERMDFFRFAEEYFDLKFSNPPSPPFAKVGNSLTPPLKKGDIGNTVRNDYCV